MDPFQADYQVHPHGYLDGPVRSFVHGLADPSPEPAGGAALALTAAMAASLLSLVAGADLGRATDPRERQALNACRTHAGDLRERAQTLVDGDVVAYRRVMSALALAGDTDERRRARRAALDAALERATDVPLAVAETALDVVDLAAGLTLDARSPLRGDLAASRALAEGAARGALATASVNIAVMHHQTKVARLEERVRRIQRRLTTASSDGLAE